MRGCVLSEIMAEDCVASYRGESQNQSETYDDSSLGITDEHERLHVRAPATRRGARTWTHPQTQRAHDQFCAQ